MSCLVLPLAGRADEGTWRVWLEAKFQRAPVSEPFAEAKRTELVVGTLADGELTTLSKDAFAALATDWAAFATRAKQNAAADLAELKPRYERDARKTIVYAALESEKPIVAAAVLAPGFLDLWKDSLGEKVLVVVPNRFTAFVFPRLASDYQSFFPLVFRKYRETSQPVSVEVFEVSRAGWRCVGVYAEP